MNLPMTGSMGLDHRRRWAALLLVGALLAGCAAPGGGEVEEASAACLPTRPCHFVTPHGMKVVLVESRANPMAVISYGVPGGGSAFDPPGKEGMAYLTAQMMAEAAGDRPYRAFQERQAFYGLEIKVSAGRDDLRASVQSLSEHLEEAFALFSDVLLRPRFDESDWERIKRIHLAGLLKEKEQPEHVASLALFKRVFSRHAYGHAPKGTPESVKGLTVGDFRSFHQQVVRAPGAVLSVAGDLSLQQLKALTARHLEGLSGSKGSVVAVPAAPVSKKGIREHIPGEGSQTVFRLGLSTGMAHGDPDAFPSLVMNHLLGGGGFSSRLTQELRTKRGLTYGVYTRPSPLRAGGVLVVATSTKTATAGEALGLMRWEIERMAREGVTAEELEDCKRELTGSFPLELDGLAKLAGLWTNVMLYDLGEDYLSTWKDKVMAVTQADVLRVAQRVLRWNSFHVVSVGKEGPAAEVYPPEEPDDAGETSAQAKSPGKKSPKPGPGPKIAKPAPSPQPKAAALLKPPAPAPKKSPKAIRADADE
ncbi:MAG: insulinase family protein [Magnetococcales bacterium]|nr:insulinase family protein [Magnetococcales bacterium]